MSVISKLFVILALIVFAAGAGAATQKADDDVSARKEPEEISSATLQLQVLLDRAMFSPGVIDGRMGTNAETAIKAFQQSQSLEATGKMDDRTSEALLAAPGFSDEITSSYTISRDDVDRDYITSVPKEMADQAKLAALAYTDIKELLSERFHTTPELLERLNPDADWEQGSVITVPNVYPTWILTKEERKEAAERAGKKEKEQRSEDKDGDEEEDKEIAEKETELDDRLLSSGLVKKTTGSVTVIVTKSDTSLLVVDEQGQIVFHAPVSAGSEHDPLPIGHWKVNGTEHNPKFNYNPELFWDAEASDEKAKIPPGPNNPVGVAWVDVSKPHYGLHGTPNPEKIGYTQSHGCVRLTNWDVLRLADLVKPETEVLFLERLEDLEKDLGKNEQDEEKKKKDGA